MIVVLARLRVKPGLESKIKELVQGVVEATRRETGCISYRLLQDFADAAEFSFVEEWQSKEALQAHMQTAHFLKWRDQSAPLVAERASKVYDAQQV